jgi:hypothetical protein
MNRVSLREAFHGEEDMAQTGATVDARGPDEVSVMVKGGRITFRVAPEVPDDQVLKPEHLDGFLQIVLELEDGSELNVFLNENDGDEESDVDVHLIPAAERSRENFG